MYGPMGAYRRLLHIGELRPDMAQQLAAEKLQSLCKALVGYRPATGELGWRARFGLAKRSAALAPPQGLYIYGEVGRGKSMLMDLFFDVAPVATKRRVHFHAFMQEVHTRLNDRRKTGKKLDGDDPIPPVAKAIAEGAWLLCFDEFQVDNIADAMILGRLFECMFDLGVVVVATSNRPPQDLYKDGLQRDRFLPFINLLCQKLDILELASEIDYRLGRIKGLDVYRTPLSAKADAALDADFARLIGDVVAKPDYVMSKGRQVHLPLVADGVARASFADLCAANLGPGDYLAIATHFHTLVLDRIPLLGPENRNEAKRFVTLIDALYEHKVKLVCTAAAPPQSLYPTGDGSFEFHRTASRLMEMQAADYIQRPHLT